MCGIKNVIKFAGFNYRLYIRLYNINNKRTNFKKAKWGFFDTFLLLIHLGILGLIIARMVI